MAQACGHDHTSAAGVSGPRLARELAAAERLCASRAQRLTKPRRRVLELLLQSEGPRKAYDLMADFEPGGPPAKPPTVYRALEFLEREGLTHRIESLNAYVACRHTDAAHAAAFLICDCCGAAREVEPGRNEALEREAAAAGYALRAVTVEAHGLCPDCRT